MNSINLWIRAGIAAHVHGFFHLASLKAGQPDRLLEILTKLLLENNN